MSDLKNDVNARILYTALQRMTDDRAVIKDAFQHWVAELSNSPFDVIETVGGLEKYLGLDTQERKVLMIGMHAAANRAEHELREVPDYVVGNSVAPAPTAKEAAPKLRARQPVVELAEGYFARVLNETKKVAMSSYRELASILEDEGLDGISGELDKAVKKASSGQLELPASTSEDGCQNLCHAFYNLLAEVVGPIDADVVSNRAITALLDMEAAARYDPRDLL